MHVLLESNSATNNRESVTARRQTKPSDRQISTMESLTAEQSNKYANAPMLGAPPASDVIHVPAHTRLLVCACVSVCCGCLVILFVAMAFFHVWCVCVCVNQHQIAQRTRSTFCKLIMSSHIRTTQNAPQTERPGCRSNTQTRTSNTNFEDCIVLLIVTLKTLTVCD